MTNLYLAVKCVVRFYNHRGTAERMIKEGKKAVNWTRRSCHDFNDNQIRLQFFALACNLGNFFRQAAPPKSVRHWTTTTLRELFAAILGRVRRLWTLVESTVLPTSDGRDADAGILSAFGETQGDLTRSRRKQRFQRRRSG